jgi:DNA-binding protein HU-beta
MNNQQLAEKMATDANITIREAKAALESFMAHVGDALSAGDSVSLLGFGTFNTRARAERLGRNPKTGEALTIPSSVVSTFKSGKKLTEKLNS